MKTNAKQIPNTSIISFFSSYCCFVLYEYATMHSSYWEMECTIPTLSESGKLCANDILNIIWLRNFTIDIKKWQNLDESRHHYVLTMCILGSFAIKFPAVVRIILMGNELGLYQFVLWCVKCYFYYCLTCEIKMESETWQFVVSLICVTCARLKKYESHTRTLPRRMREAKRGKSRKETSKENEGEEVSFHLIASLWSQFHFRRTYYS